MPGTPIDLGAMLLVGTTGNPLVTLCEQVGCMTHPLDRGACPLYDGEAEVESGLDTRAEGKYNALLTKASDQRAHRKGKRALYGTSNGGRWEPQLLHVEGNAAGAGPASWGGGGAGGGEAETPSSGKKRKKEGGSASKAKGEEAMAEEATEVAAGEEQSAHHVAAEEEVANATVGWAADATKQPRNTWLSCDLCGQWRRLGRMKGDALPEQWTCGQNPDPAYASCDVPQELPDDDIDRLLGLLPPKAKQTKGVGGLSSPQKLAKKLAAESAPMPGEAPPICGKSLGEVMDQLVEKAKLPAEEARAIHWHLANLEYGCATSLHNVSLSWWDQDDGNDFSGSHVVIANGFDRMVRHPRPIFPRNLPQSPQSPPYAVLRPDDTHARAGTRPRGLLRGSPRARGHVD